jgi:hypothetical protein
MGPSPTPDELVNGLDTAVRVLIAVVTAAGPDDRAIIWRAPEPHLAPPADFVPRAGLELALHGHDVAAGLGVPFEPAAGVAQRLRDHTRTWPFWRAPLGTGADAWADLLRTSGRAQR